MGELSMAAKEFQVAGGFAFVTGLVSTWKSQGMGIELIEPYSCRPGFG